MHLFKWLAIIYSLISISFADLVNVTIDDAREKIIYLPPHQWSDGPKCGSCSANKDLNQTMIFNGTWHNGIANKPGDRSGPLLATVPFFGIVHEQIQEHLPCLYASGSAVYIYCVIANRENETMDITFLIDTQVAGNYSRQLVNDGTFEYNVLVYANQSLPQDNHVLTIQNGRIDGTTSSILLDYIVYSYDKDLTTTTESPVAFTAPVSGLSAGNGQASTVNAAGKIVGGVLGSIGGILLVLLAFLWHRQSTCKGPIDVSCLSSLPPEYMSRNPVATIRSWLRSSGRPKSRFSFNPSLLFEPIMMNKEHTTPTTFRRPPPITTVHPIHPYPQCPDSTNLLQPNRVVNPTPALDPRNEPSQPLSIIEWQRRTQREADDVPPRFDVSDVDMSSYYDFSSDTPDTPPPRQPRLKRFTVVNN